jgi:hypothetical protein
LCSEIQDSKLSQKEHFQLADLKQLKKKIEVELHFLKTCRIFRCGHENAMRRRWRKNSLLLGDITGDGMFMLRPIRF